MLSLTQTLHTEQKSTCMNINACNRHLFITNLLKLILSNELVLVQGKSLSFHSLVGILRLIAFYWPTFNPLFSSISFLSHFNLIFFQWTIICCRSSHTILAPPRLQWTPPMQQHLVRQRQSQARQSHMLLPPLRQRLLTLELEWLLQEQARRKFPLIGMMLMLSKACNIQCLATP